MTCRQRGIGTWLGLLAAVLQPSAAGAMCNAIPTTERTFASTRGAIDRPFVSPGRGVKLALGPCDEGATFEALATTVEITFAPPDGPPATVVLPPESIFSVLDTELVFEFPNTRLLLGELRTGPATIVAYVDGAEVVRIDRLGTRGADCSLRPHAVFASFTALPPPNSFHCLATSVCEPGQELTVRATIDAAGHLLVPFDWSNVFPPGQGFDPIARLVRAGQSGLEAFPAPDPRAGRGIVIPSAAYVSSHTVTGAVLPPFLDVGPPVGVGPFPGSTLIGTVDSLDGVLRVARAVGDAPESEIFDLWSRLERGVGAIVLGFPTAIEEPLVDLRSVRASGRMTALEEFGHGAGTAGLLLYDNQSGRLGRVSAADGNGELPRRVAVSDELAAFYDVERDLLQPDLTVFSIAELPVEGLAGAVPIDDGDLIVTGLFGANGTAVPPAIGAGIVGGYAGPSRDVAFFDVGTGLTSEGRPVGGGDLVETALGIRNRRAPERFAAFGGVLAPLGPDTPGRVFAIGNRAVYLVCDGPCAELDGTPRDMILKLLEADGSQRALARDPGAPFVFTGALIGLAVHENARYGSGPSGVADLDGDGCLDGIFLAVYDLDGDRLLVPPTPSGAPLAVPADGAIFAATEHVLALALEEQSVGPMNCDDDRTDRVAALFNGRTGILLNTREPMTGAGFSQGGGLLSFLQPEDVLGRPLGDTFLNVVRDSDGDELPDPYDDCPLHADLEQRDADQDGIGDACDAACDGGGCQPGAWRATPGLTPRVRSCMRRVQRASGLLLASELTRELDCPYSDDCAAVVSRARPDARTAHALVARCSEADLAALGMCGSTSEAIVAVEPGQGCLAAAARSAARSMTAAQHDQGARGADPACVRRLGRIMREYAGRRHEQVALCRRRWLDGAELRRADGTILEDLGACHLEARTARTLARIGRRTRLRIERACTATAIGTLGACGRLSPPTLDALVSESGGSGCLISTHRTAVDRLLALELGALAPTPETRPTAVPCPPRPTPVVTPTPQPHSISVRVLLEGSDGRSADLDVGWTGLAHDQQVLGGAGFDATLVCDGSAPVCPFFAALAGVALAAPMPLSTGGVSTCTTLHFEGDLVGTYDTMSGQLDAVLPLEARVHLEGSVDQPCPACVTADGRPTLGELGTCSGGARSGAACHVGGLAGAGFGTAAGTSEDCPPTGGLIATFHLSVPATTELVTWQTTPASPNCTAPGFRNRKCLCPGDVGEPSKPHPCSDDSAQPVDGSLCVAVEGEDGICPEGPIDTVCADQPWRGCLVADDCVTGSCVTRPRSCFLDPIVRDGTPDPPSSGAALPTLVGTFCMPPATSPAVNATAGFPGPAAFVMPARVVSRR